MEAGRSYHSVDVLKLNNCQLRTLGIRHGNNFEAECYFCPVLRVQGEKQSGLMQQLNGGIARLLEDKKGRLSPLQPQLGGMVLPAPVPNSLASQGKIQALLLTRCRQTRNRGLGMLRPDQATNIFRSWAV